MQSKIESTLWHKRQNCRLCGSDHLKEVINLPPMPVATPNFRVRGVSSDHPIYREPVPMPLHICNKCGFLQIIYVGNADIQYRDYMYTTSLSLGLPQHFIDSASHLIAKVQLEKGKHIVEFGSNDGTYLRAFKAEGMEVTGIDPARVIAENATKSGITTYPEFFDEKLAHTIRNEVGAADLIVANNVIANIDDFAGVFKAAKILLSEQGSFVFETQYGLDVTENYLLDTIYHEHLSYVNIAPLVRVLPTYGLEVYDVEHVNTKGGSIRVFVALIESKHPISENVAKFVKLEDDTACETQEYFNTFGAGIKAIKETVNQIVDEARARGEKVAGYGVSVGTTTMLGQLGLSQKIDFLIDDDPEKPKALYGPNYDIPVCPKDQLIAQNVKLVVSFAWRYTDAIKANNPHYVENGGKFLIPLPQPKLT